MDQYQDEAGGAAMDQWSEDDGTSFDQGAEAPYPQQQQPQGIDPRHYNQAVDELEYYRQRDYDHSTQQSAQQAQMALAQRELQLAQAFHAKRKEARQIMNDDPERALQLVEEAAAGERRQRQQSQTEIIEAAGRAIQDVQRQASLPQTIQQVAQQYQLGQDAASFLRELPLDYIPVVAQALGQSEQKVRNLQQRLQRGGQPQQRGGGAPTAPAYRGAPPTRQAEDGSDEQLVAALQAMGIG